MKLSLIIPTYNEKENIPFLISKISKEFKKSKIPGEIIVIDDNSPDGTGKILDYLKKKYHFLKVMHRKNKFGLSSAVLEGIRISKGQTIAVMDADFSHPIDKLPVMYKLIKSNQADLVIGSRYIPGGKIFGWEIYRKAQSKFATLLARTFTYIKDPMSGFFMIKKSLLRELDLNPKGFKLLLEILIKTKSVRIKEIPITFVNRSKGKSKASIKEIIYYLINLTGYLKYKKNVITEFFKFAFVGLIGTIINLIILYSLTEFLGIYYIISAIFAFIIAATNNFILNKTWTFNEKISYKTLDKYSQFFSVSLVALLINISFLYILTEFLGIHYLISQVIAIGLALSINFLGNKIWTFSR